jgi:hypothetical protein
MNDWKLTQIEPPSIGITVLVYNEFTQEYEIILRDNTDDIYYYKWWMPLPMPPITY